MARRSTALCLPLLLGCSTAVRGAYLQHGAYGRAARRDRSASARLVAPTPPQPVIAGDAEAPEPMPVAKTGDEWLGSALAVRVDTVSAGVLDELRASAAAVVATAERPRRKDEAWRRTDLTSLFAAKLALPSGEVEEAAVGGVVEEPSAGMRLVLVDGAVSSDLSDLSALPDGVSVGSVGSLNAALASRVVEQLRSLPEEGADKRTELGAYTFAALNQASFTDVACVHVPAGTSVPRPLCVYVLSSGAPEEGVMAASHPNLVVSLDEGAELQMMQHYAPAATAPSPYFTNALTRLTIGENATLRHAYVQEQGPQAVHIDSVMVDVRLGGKYEAQVVASGGRIARVNLGIGLNDHHASCAVQGLALATGSQLSDLHSYVLHASPDCASQQEQRNALAGAARVVFKGAVVVPRGSDNSTANQLCRTLLLSDGARVDVQPTLEIDTDEVQCTHGASIADLDDEMVFYLQSRGLDRLQARSLLLEGWARAFMSDVPSDGAKERVAAKAAVLAPETGSRASRVAELSSI